MFGSSLEGDGRKAAGLPFAVFLAGGEQGLGHLLQTQAARGGRGRHLTLDGGLVLPTVIPGHWRLEHRVPGYTRTQPHSSDRPGEKVTAPLEPHFIPFSTDVGSILIEFSSSNPGEALYGEVTFNP